MTFAADTTTPTQVIPVTIVDSVDVELSEVFYVRLEKTSSIPSFVTISETDGLAEVEIIDDDAGTVGFVDDEIEVNEGDSFRLGIGVLSPAGNCPIQFPIDVSFSYTDPDGALSPIATRTDLVHVSGNAYKARFNSCQKGFYFTVSARDVTADAEAVFTLSGGPTRSDGSAARAISIGSPSTMTVKVLNGERPTGTVNVTVASSPSGRTVTVDGTTARRLTPRHGTPARPTPWTRRHPRTSSGSTAVMSSQAGAMAAPRARR